MPAFTHSAGDLVLVDWTDGKIYYAKIRKVDDKRQVCSIVFDDGSRDEARFDQIHSGEFVNPPPLRSHISLFLFPVGAFHEFAVKIVTVSCSFSFFYYFSLFASPLGSIRRPSKNYLKLNIKLLLGEEITLSLECFCKQ